MRKSKLILLLLPLLVIFGACQKEQAVQEEFQEKTTQQLTEKAQEFSNEAYQNGEVPLKTYVKIEGVITKTDAKNKQKIGKDDRFVIENEGVPYQIFNTTSDVLKVNDEVVVYGEYHGFIQSDLIEIK